MKMNIQHFKMIRSFGASPLLQTREKLLHMPTIRTNLRYIL